MGEPEVIEVNAPRNPIAGFWQRLGAFAFDIFVLAAPTFLLAFVFYDWAVRVGPWGRIFGFTVGLAYFGFLNSGVGGGQTLGKFLFDLRVVDRSGSLLSLQKSVLRYLVLWIPYFLNGISFAANPQATAWWQLLIGTLLSFVVFGGSGAIIYLFLFNRRTRQSLHDLAVGSFVVRDPPEPVPSSRCTPRLHWFVTGCWMGLTLIVPVTGYWVAKNNPTVMATAQPLIDLQKALSAQSGVRQVIVHAGTTTVVSVRTGKSSTSILQIDIQPDGSQDTHVVERAIARATLNLHPNLLGNDLLVIATHKGINLGLASWDITDRESHNAAEWRQVLSESAAAPGATVQ